MRKHQEGVTPILVITWKHSLTVEQKKAIDAALTKGLKEGGWLTVIVDNMDKSEVKAFGVPESKLGEFEDLKELIENATKGKE